MILEEYFGDWMKVIDKRELLKATSFIKSLYTKNLCTPAYGDIFKAFEYTPYNELKVVMLAQDPYPQKGVATGIAFANKGSAVTMSPSLQVLEEAVVDYTNPDCMNRSFDKTMRLWCEQGILLLNSSLTVQVGNPGSHSVYWRPFIISLLKKLALYNPGLIYVLWGSSANSFISYINPKDTILKLNHPAYYARTNTKIDPSFFIELNDIVYSKYGFKLKLYNKIYETD